MFISTLETVPLFAIWPIIGWLGSMVGKTDIQNPPNEHADLPSGLAYEGVQKIDQKWSTEPAEECMKTDCRV